MALDALKARLEMGHTSPTYHSNSGSGFVSGLASTQGQGTCGSWCGLACRPSGSIDTCSAAQGGLQRGAAGPSGLQDTLAAREHELAALRQQLAALQIERNVEVEALTDERDGLDAALEVPRLHLHFRTPA